MFKKKGEKGRMYKLYGVSLHVERVVILVCKWAGHWVNLNACYGPTSTHIHTYLFLIILPTQNADLLPNFPHRNTKKQILQIMFLF